MNLLVDGDILTYRAAFSCANDSIEDAFEYMDGLIDEIVGEVLWDGDLSNLEVFLTGKGNFRYDVQPTYKQNRSGKPKPEHLPDLREYLWQEYDAKMSEGQEADDDITIRATDLGPSTVIASIDKDFLQVPCWHYNINRKTMKRVTPFEGLKFVYSQILMGDAADNVFGLKGIGLVKSNKMLDGANTEREMYDRCVAAYGGDTSKVIENARLLWLRREEGETWQPPAKD